MGPGNGDDVRFFFVFLGTLCVMFPFCLDCDCG